MKDARQKKILDIISSNDIETQNQLIDALRAEGVNSAQATISRDIKELRLVKELTPQGTYRYAAPMGLDAVSHSEKLQVIFKECVTSIACAQNIVVLKTLPGLAGAACSTIDMMGIPNVVGTLAGDDTAFVVMQDTTSCDLFGEELKKFL